MAGMVSYSIGTSKVFPVRLSVIVSVSLGMGLSWRVSGMVRLWLLILGSWGLAAETAEQTQTPGATGVVCNVQICACIY
jgi:hypothetical protein